MSKLKNATDISPITRQRVLDRDARRCVICHRAHCLELAHYIGRAQLGLGIPENLVVLCTECHMAYDNGDKRTIHGEIIKSYLDGWYPNFKDEDRVYNKYRWLDETERTTEG